MTRTLIALTLTLTVVLSGCQLFSIHRIDIQQGNALDTETVEQLQVGMTPQQVTFLLGNPLVADSFNPDRWDYVYYLKPGEGERVERRLTVYFENGIVSQIDQPI